MNLYIFADIQSLMNDKMYLTCYWTFQVKRTSDFGHGGFTFWCRGFLKSFQISVMGIGQCFAINIVVISSCYMI